jgi:putative glutathione S-transferase
MLNSEFNDLAKNKDLDLYPESLRSAIDEVNSWVYPTVVSIPKAVVVTLTA